MIPYISYSSFSLYQKCKRAYQYSKLQHRKSPPTYETAQMALGTAVDAHFKIRFAEKLGDIQKTQVIFRSMIGQIQTENTHVLELAGTIAEQAERVGLFDRLIDMGVKAVEQDITTKHNDATLLAKLDCIYKDSPFDFKVTGYNSAKPKKPNRRNLFTIDPSGKITENFCLTVSGINEFWKEQLAFYNLALKTKPPYIGFILEILLDHEQQPHFTLYQYDIEETYLINYGKEIDEFWKWMLTQTPTSPLEDVIPSKYRCEPFGIPRPCCVLCPAYSNMIELTNIFG